MNITIDIPDDKIQNALHSAFTGGIAYWGRLADCSAIAAGPLSAEVMRPRGYVHLRVLPGLADKMPRPRSLNRRSVAIGLQLMALHAPGHFAMLLHGTGDMNTGDLLVQYAVFGKAVFG